MDAMLATRISLPLLLVVFVAVLIVWPVVRLRRQTGAWAITIHRETEPGQRLVAVAFLGIGIATAVFVTIHTLRGPEVLAVWALPDFATWLGLGIAAAGVALVAAAQHEMGASFRIGIDDQDTALVEDGLFAIVRNPIFSGLGVLLGGMFVAVPCPGSLGIWGVAVATIAMQTRLEERHLLAHHGEAYRSYASRVGRFLPGVGRLAGAAAGEGGR
ncbi:MAG: isoprenylcysteine carboxylmethyltransferase family protein [bacterium]|nr:isoprenylcysteine carboxylmethyltransferase family protein [bacterium]MCP5071381.1 isoprenylcysteine carboxylmethyltransferase family protein [bacterium]